MEKVFKNFMGKKISEEQINAVQKEGYHEFIRNLIPGGYEVILAKTETGLINGKKKCVFIVSEVPSEEKLNKDFGLQEVEFVSKAGTEKKIGMYGLCEGRKFFCANAKQPKQSKSEKSV